MSQPRTKIKIRQTLGGTGEQRATKGTVHQSSIRDTTSAIVEREAARHEKHVTTLDFERDDRATVRFDENQISAIRTLATQRYANVSGPAGTGKTTIVAGALPIIAAQVRQIDWGAARTAGQTPSNSRRPAIALVTFTNVSARNLASKIPDEWSNHCMSIHSMLSFAPIRSAAEAETYNLKFDTNAKMMFEPRYHSTNKLPYDVIFIDEAGIVGTPLWHQILDACEPETRIYMLGDLYQLKAIHGASPMPFAMHEWPTSYLEKIYRQADGSPIISQAHNIRRGITPDHVPGKFLCGENERIASQVLPAQKHVALYIKHLHAKGMFDPAQDVIITPQNDGSLGQIAWNQRFHFQFNPPTADPKTGVIPNPPILIRTAVGEIDLSVGDKVMATDNGGRSATEARFNNGSIGIITAIYPNPDYKGDMTGLGAMDLGAVTDMDGQLDMVDLFSEVEAARDALDETAVPDDGEDKDKKRRAGSHIVEVTEVATGDKYVLTRSAEIANLRRAYAVTGHKFQGSQARRVVVVIHSSVHSNMLSREWLYTAVTRAKEAVILLHDKPSLLRCLSRQEIVGTNAKDKAARLVKLYSKSHERAAPPRIPEPVALPPSPETLAALAALGDAS